MNIENNIPNTIINRFSFKELADGIYALDFTDNHFHIISTINEETPFPRYLEGKQEDIYFLEKKNNYANLFFPDKIVLETNEYMENQKVYEVIIQRFKSWVRRSSIMYIYNLEEYIAGISNANYDCDIEFELWCSTLSYKSPKVLEDEYVSTSLDQHLNRIMKKLTPEVMLNYCQSRIQGQGLQLKKAVFQVYRYMQQVTEDTPFQAENWLLTAPSGSGKTEFFRAIKDLFAQYHVPIPVVQIDLSQITETGYKGSNVSSIPNRILSENPNGGGIGICFLDEADKKFIPSYSSQGINVNAAVQANLLTMLEGIETNIDIKSQTRIFDSSKTMFVLMGAFQDIRNAKQEKETKTSTLGFCSSHEKLNTSSKASDSFYEDLELQDLIDSGMQEELAGRLVQIVNFHKLSDDDMLKLIKYKVNEIASALRVNIEISDTAAEEFLTISFGSLGIRRPMNAIRELAQNTVAEVFFDGGFDPKLNKVIIDSLHTAHIEKSVNTLIELEQ